MRTREAARVAIGIAIAAALALPVSPATGATKTTKRPAIGGACSAVGQRVTISGRAAVCTKVGSRQLWRAGTATTAAQNAATDVGVTADEIRVAQIVSTTGANSAGHSGFEKGFEAYVEALNERGGVSGRKIKIVSTRTDNSEATRQAAEFQAAVEQDKVFLVLGSWPNFGGAEYAIANKIPVVATPYDRGMLRSDTFFGITNGSWRAADPNNVPPAPPAITAAPDAYIAGKLGVTKIGAFGYSQTASKAGAEQLCNAVKALAFDCSFLDTSLDFGFTDIGASIEKVKSSGAQHFYAAMDLNGCTTILRSFKRAGLENVTFRCAVGYGPDAIEKYPDLIDKMFVALASAPLDGDNAEAQKFVAELKKRKPGVDASTTTLNGWLAGIFVEDVLKELGPNVTRARFIETGRTNPKFSTWNANGLLNDVDWTRNLFDDYANPTWKPDPKVCAGYLMRPDLVKKRWVQVGEKPKLCMRGVTTQAELAAKMAADKNTLNV